MDPAVSSVEQTTNMTTASLYRVRSVAGVATAVPLALGSAEVRFPNGRFQNFQVIGVDDVTAPVTLRAPDAVIVDSGGTTGKLDTLAADVATWPRDQSLLEAPTRPLAGGDELIVNDQRVQVVAVSDGLSRFPPRPLMYTTLSNAERILLPERRRLTFILVTIAAGELPGEIAMRISEQTGLRARTAEELKADTVRWSLVNSEDVGDMAAMLWIAMLVGFGVTGVLLYLFTNDSLKQYAVLKAMGATSCTLLGMVFVQAGLCGVLGSGLGLGLCAIVGQAAVAAGYPFRMMWFTPLLGGVVVVLVSVVAATISARTVLKLEPALVFAGR
jgi:putative ABC transport system permease protein